MRYVRGFLGFLWDFVVGDDWTVAVGIAVSIGLTAFLVDRGFDVWWLMPIAVVIVLAGSLWRATTRR